MLVILRSLYLEVPTHPSTPKVLRVKERAQTLLSVVITFGLAIKSIKKLEGGLVYPKPV